MKKYKFFLILNLFLGSWVAICDPWIMPEEELFVKKLEFYSIRDGFSIDSSSYPIPWALARNPTEDVYQNYSEMTNYRIILENKLEKSSKQNINKIKLRSNSSIYPFRTIDAKTKDINSFAISSSYLGERFATKLTVNVSENPFHEKEYYFDDSYIALVSGNFILGIGNYDRWWGPSHHASLILSNYSRNAPGLFIRSLEGFTSPFPIIRSFGKLNFSFFVNQLESNRAVKKPYLIGGRLSMNPINGLTIGLTRTIMFGGKGKDNSFGALWDSIRGDASVGSGSGNLNVDNELAGLDIKYSFDINEVVWSLYLQYIGEDGTDYWPWRTFYIFGSEFIFSNNEMIQSINFEYINTYYNGADIGTNVIYEHSSYSSGYRYKGSPIGAFMDGDSNYGHLSYNGQLNETIELKFSIFYGNFNKDNSGTRNTWGINNREFYGSTLGLDFILEKDIKVGFFLTHINEELTYRNRSLDRNIGGLSFDYNF